MDERIARVADLQLRMYCSAVPRRSSRARVLHSTRLPTLPTIPGKCAERRRVPPEPAAGHARLLVIEPRRWDDPMLRSRVSD